MALLIVAVVVLLLTFVSGQSLPNMNLRIVPDSIAEKYNAHCLDGSSPGMYVRTSSQVDPSNPSSNWALFLEGGGWCYASTPDETLQSCADWWGQGTNDAASSTPDYGGFLSADPSINPTFYNWNMAFFMYCDGASFGSAAEEPYSVNNRSLWLRGRANFDALIEDLVTNYGLGNTSDVHLILSGGSAGALAVYFNLDHLAEIVPPTVTVLGLPDGGFFLDAENLATGEYTYRSYFIGADPIWNVTAGQGTNLDCLAAHANNDTWMCLMSPYILPYIKTPIFVMNSAFDAWQVPNLYGLSCLNNGVQCTGADETALLQNRVTMVNQVLGGAKAGIDGCYIDSCYVHEQNVNYCSSQSIPNCVGWSPLMSGSEKWNYTVQIASPLPATQPPAVTPQQAFTIWYENHISPSVSDKSFFAVDIATYLTNPTCVWTGHPV